MCSRISASWLAPLFSALVLAACGSGSSDPTPAPPGAARVSPEAAPAEPTWAQVEIRATGLEARIDELDRRLKREDQ
jgi:hypothetical protein